MLKILQIGCINHILWEVVIYIGHREDRPMIQCMMCRDFDPVPIQLLVVATRRLLRKALRLPWQEHFKSGVALAEHPFVQQTQHSDVSSQPSRGKIVIQERLSRRKTQFMEETVLCMTDFSQQ